MSLRKYGPGLRSPRRPAETESRAQAPRHRRIQDQGRHHRPIPWSRLHGHGQRRPRPRPAAQGPRDRRPEPLPARVRDLAGEDEGRREPAPGAQGRRRALPRDGRGSRGRGHRVAPARGAEAEGRLPGQAHGVPRDHRGGDRGSHRASPRARHEARRGAGGPARPRPARRLRGLAGAVAPGRWRALGGPGAERGDPARRRARARADGVPRRGLLGPRRTVRGARHRRSTRVSSSSTASRVATSRDFDPATGALADGSGAVHLREADAGELADAPRATSAYTVASAESKPFTERPKPPFKTTTLQQEAGQQAPLQRGPHDVGRAGPLRAWLHHLHAYRLGEALRAGRRRGPGADRRAVRPGVPPAGAAHVREQGQERAGGARGDPARRARASAPPSRSGASSSRDEQALYELVWMRTVASQMPDARGRSLTLRLAGHVDRRRAGDLPRVGPHLRVPRLPHGLRRRQRGARVRRGRDRTSPRSARAKASPAKGSRRSGTRPSRRRATPRRAWSRSSKTAAIGRPSTYASIINTITNERGYVWKKGNALVPSWTAFAKTQLLERYFPHLVDYDFTATMEEALDEVAAGPRRVREVAPHLLLRERHRRVCRSWCPRRTSPRST